MACEQCKAFAPALVVHGASHAASGFCARGAGDRLVADATHQREGCLGRKHFVGIAPVKRGMRHAGGWPSRIAGELRQPSGFVDRLSAVPFGFDVDRLDRREAAGVARQIGRQVVAFQRRIVAVAKGNWLLVLQPRVRVVPQVPEMLVRIDERLVEFHQEPFALLAAASSSA